MSKEPIRRLTVASLLIAGLALTGCSTAAPATQSGDAVEDVESVTFQLNWAWGGASAGYAVTDVDGHDEQHGADITFEQGNGSGPAAQLVASGQADMGNADATVIAQQVQAGAPLVILAIQNQVPVLAVQSAPETGIESVEDLAGMSVGVQAGTSGQFLLPLLLEGAGVSIDEVEEVNLQVPAYVPSVIEGNVDAVVGDVQISPLQFRAQGVEFNEISFADGGVTAPSHAIFTTRSFLEENPEAVRRTLAAVLDGWASTIQDPQNAAEAVNGLLPDVPVETTLGELERTPWLMCGPWAEYLGLGEAEDVAAGLDLIFEAGLLEEEIAPESLYDFSYLPQESDLHACSDLYTE